MAKWLRRLLFVIVLLLVACGLLFIPGVQRSLFLTFASSDERPISVDYLRLLPGSFVAEGLEVSEGQYLVRVPSLEAEFSFGALLRGRLFVERMVSENVYVKIRKDERADIEKDREKGENDVPDFKGVLGGVSPIEIVELDVGGLVVGAGGEEAEFRIQAEELLAGQTGTVSLRFNPLADSPETLPAAEVVVSVTMSDDRSLEEIGLEGRLDSRSEKIQGNVQIDGSFQKTELGESYSVSIHSDNLLPEGGISLAGDFSAGEGVVDLEVKARGESLDFLQTFTSSALPPISFDMEGSTKWDSVEGFRLIQFQYRLESEAGAFQGFADPLRATGHFQLSADTDSLTINKMDFSVAPPLDAKPWVSIQILQPRTFAFGDSLDIPDGEIAELSVFLPEDFLNSFESGFRFADLNGSLQLVGNDENVSLTAEEPFSTSVRSVNNDAAVAVRLEPGAVLSTSFLKTSSVLILSEGERQMNLKLEAEFEGADYSQVSFNVMAEGAIAPLLALNPELLRREDGTVQMDLSGNYGEGLSLEGFLRADGVGVDGYDPMNIELTLRGGELDLNEQNVAKAELDLNWEVADRQSSISGLKVEASQGDDGRWTVDMPQGLLNLDVGSFPKSASSKTSVSDGSDELSIALPFGPGDFDWLREPAALPINVGEFSLRGAVSDAEISYDFTLKVSDLFPSEEGLIEVTMDPVAADSSLLGGTFSSKIRLDSTAVPTRVGGEARVRNLVAGGVDSGLDVAFTVTPGGPVDPIRLEVSPEGSDIVLFDLRSDLGQNEMRAEFKLDFANWLRTPFREAIPNLATGLLEGEISLREGALDTSLAVTGLSPLDAFESYDASVKASVETTESLTGEGALQVKNAKDETSDLKIEASKTGTHSLGLSIRGERLDLEMLQGFASVWSASRPSDEIGDTEETETDESQHWPLESLPFEVAGTFSLGQLIMAEIPSFRNFEGRFGADSRQGTLQLSADWLQDAPIALEGRISQSGGGVDGSIAGKVRRLPLGPLLSEINPQETPTIEGTSTLSIDFAGRADSLEDLPSKMVGGFDLLVKDGLLRSLRPEARVTRLVSVGSVAGLVLGSKLNRPGISALSELIDLFKVVPFDQLELSLERNEDRETVVDSLNFAGPYFSMTGSGRIEAADLDEVSDAPMNLDLSLGSRAPMSSPLKTLALLGPDIDERGYRLWKKPIQITGTLQQPNADDLWSLIIQAVERAATMSSKDLRRESEEAGEDAGEKPEKPSTEEIIERGVNSIFDLLGS